MHFKPLFAGAETQQVKFIKLFQKQSSFLNSFCRGDGLSEYLFQRVPVMLLNVNNIDWFIRLF